MTRLCSFVCLVPFVWAGCTLGNTITSRPPQEVKAAEHAVSALSLLQDMKEPRASHTATLLPDGTVLVAGGFQKGPDGRSQLYSKTAEIYDPKARTFQATGALLSPRCGHTATLLPNGLVLFIGGFNDKGMLSTAELYDPTSGTFSLAGETNEARGGFTSTLLADGRVLIVGGGERTATASAEIYDPVTRLFTKTGSLLRARLGHTATLLADGRVLILGGAPGRGDVIASAEIYDPTRGEFISAGDMITARYKHAAILLDDGRVLAVGGSDARDWRGKYANAEIYDPKTNTFARTADLNFERFKLSEALASLEGGRVLIAGGSSEIEIFDLKTLAFLPAARMTAANYDGVVTVLPGGGVLITGGYDDRLRASRGAWLFKG